MPILTWQQVAAPDFSTAQRANERAQQLILGGLEAAKSVPASIQKTQEAVAGVEQDYVNQQAAVGLQKATTPEMVDSVLGQIFRPSQERGGASLDPSRLTPEILGLVEARKKELTGIRDDATEAARVTSALEIAPQSLEGAIGVLGSGPFRKQQDVIAAALAADTLFDSKGQAAAAVARATGRGRGGTGKKDEVPSEWKNIAEELRLAGDVRGAVKFFGGLDPEKRILLRKGFEAVGATDILGSIKDGGSVPTTGNRSYRSGSEPQRLVIRHSDLLTKIKDAGLPPPPGYDFEGNPTSDLPPTYGEVFEYDDKIVRPMSNTLPKGKDSGASGPYQIVPKTRAWAAQEVFGDDWRSVRQTMENEKLLAAKIWEKQGAAAWKDSLEGLLKGAGIDTPAKEYFANRSFEEMAPMLSALETGMLPDNFQSKIEALTASVAERKLKFSTGAEQAVMENAGKSESMAAAAERVTKNLSGLGGKGVDGAVVLDFMENLKAHARAKGITVSAAELGSLILGSVQGDQSVLTWADVASNFDIRKGTAETRLGAIPAARKAVEDLKGDEENLKQAAAIRAKYDEKKTELSAAIEGAMLTPARMRGLYSKFLPINTASNELREIFGRPGADRTAPAPTARDLMPAGGSAVPSAPVLQSLPEDGQAPSSQEPSKAVEANLAEALSRKPSLSPLAPETEEQKKVAQDLTSQIQEKKILLERLENANTNRGMTPEIKRRKQEVFALEQKLSTHNVVSWFQRLWADNETEEVQKARDAFSKYQEENLDRTVTAEEFLPMYAEKLKKEAEDLAAGKAKKAAEAEAKKAAKAAEKAAKEAARLEEKRKAEQLLLEDARKAAQLRDREEAQAKPAAEQRKKEIEAVNRMLPSWLK